MDPYVEGNTRQLAGDKARRHHFELYRLCLRPHKQNAEKQEPTNNFHKLILLQKLFDQLTLNFQQTTNDEARKE